jgi:hypothetical protein
MIHQLTFSPAEQTSEEIIEGLTLLMEFCPLLNNIDTQTQNNNVESLLNEMVKLSIISADDQGKILELRLVVLACTVVLMKK